MTILEYMKDHVLYLDGGMGTLLQEKGLRPGELPERWNKSHPEEIIAIQKAYYEAGSNVVSTNTFGANLLKFEMTELKELIEAAIDCARTARKEAGESQAAKGIAPSEKFIALDVGPIGKLLKPYGDFEFEEAVNVYKETIRIGAEYGADLVFIETMNDSYDTKAALLACKEVCDLPVFVSNAYGEDGKLMTGAVPSAMTAMLEGMHADAIGCNCSLAPSMLRGVVKEYLEYASVPVLVKPNAGLPRSENGRTVYDVSIPDYAKEMAEFMCQGARILGGCCGTTPEFIKAVVEATKDIPVKEVTDRNRTLISSYTHAVEFGDTPILIGERINPTGKKKFKEALRKKDIDYILGEGLSQQEKGVQVLDVNVGLPEIDEVAMLREVAFELQAIIDLPLQIDTTNITAMETALRYYNGKAMINSVNGKEESMEAIFPLVQKYGGLVVCLTLDEEGIPETAQKRVAIAEKIIQKAAEYGIPKKDLIFDTLAMTVSADQKAALATLKALRTIRQELHCHTSLGVSNVSFGLPAREVITAVFFTIAMENGLSAAIMNPGNNEMMKSYFSFKALRGLDDNCTSYIENIEKYVVKPARDAAAAPAAVKTEVKNEYASELQRAIVKGLREQAANLTKKLLTEREALEIVNGEIIPALDIVGQGFEKKTMYLPQLLMSAEASQCAFEEIKKHMEKTGGSGVTRGKFVIATVHGDIHDIGKNIVKLILENYGFQVYDLGKDVPEETVVETVIREHAPVVGLSALMTTTVPAMEKTIKLLREKAPWAKVVVGGAVLTQEYADSIGADCYAKDAMATVRYALSLEE